MPIKKKINFVFENYFKFLKQWNKPISQENFKDFKDNLDMYFSGEIFRHLRSVKDIGNKQFIPLEIWSCYLRMKIFAVAAED